MNIQEIDIQKIKPYENNPRVNDAAVPYVAESIRKFGFKVPIVIDRNYVIVTGHTRYKASQLLKLKKVPCIIADDLTEEQIKAFRLVDNKVTEKSEWDIELLEQELSEIANIDMEEFNFDLEHFIDIPDELEMERLSDDGEKEFLEYLKYENKKIPITAEEIELLNKKYEVYINEYKMSYGFVKFLLGE